MKASRIYKYKINKNHFQSRGETFSRSWQLENHNKYNPYVETKPKPEYMFWDTSKNGTYRRVDK